MLSCDRASHAAVSEEGPLPPSFPKAQGFSPYSAQAFPAEFIPGLPLSSGLNLQIIPDFLEEMYSSETYVCHLYSCRMPNGPCCGYWLGLSVCH